MRSLMQTSMAPLRCHRLLLMALVLPTTAGIAMPASVQASPLARRISLSTYREVLRPARRTTPWLFSYVDCKPFDDLTLEGRWFLATNLAFVAAGGAMCTTGGSPALGMMFELAGTFSTFYHWAQLRLGGTAHPFVQIALLIDYLCAIPTLLGGGLYAASAVATGAHLPLAAVACGIGAMLAFVVACLPACHEPRRYMLVHGMWHVLGAAAGFIVAL